MTASRNILIIGATSAIAEATARLWAAEGARLYLIARNPAKLALACADLAVRGAQVESAVLDVDDLAQQAPILEAAFAALGRIDAVLIACGTLPDQTACVRDVEQTLRALHTNSVSLIALLTLIAARMQQQACGTIAVIGSVAGDRGRKSNYVYGSAKAMLATFLEGLAGRLQPSGVRVVNIKPGLVDTPMTAAMRKGPLWSQPSAVARIISRRIASAPSGSYYAPRFWWPIMLVIRLLPNAIVYRLNI
jgi:decaprenylphospho-beta-D-erythro-pentofuranosid-2-ulose 2-reductase